jgi:hypothetical protein
MAKSFNHGLLYTETIHYASSLVAQLLTFWNNWFYPKEKGPHFCDPFVLLVGRARLATPKLRFRTRDQRIKRAVLTPTDLI